MSAHRAALLDWLACAALAAKCRMLAGDRLDGVLDELDAPAQALLDALA